MKSKIEKVIIFGRKNMGMNMEFIKKDKAYNQDNIVGETIATFGANMSLLSSGKVRNLVGELIKMQMLEES